MIIRPKDKKNILISGIFVSITLLIVAAVIFIIGAESSLFQKKSSLFTTVSNSKSLKTGASIQFRGIKIGSIKTINLLDVDKIRIELRVDHKYLPFIKQDSYASIQTQGVLGDKYLEILGGSKNSASLKDKDSIKTNESSFLDSVMNKGDNILVSVNNILVKMDKILSNLPSDNIKSTLVQLDQSTQNLNRLLTSIKDKELEKTIHSLSKSSQSFERITKQIEKGPGSIHSLIYDSTVHDDLRALLGGGKRNKLLRYFIRETIQKSDEK